MFGFLFGSSGGSGRTYNVEMTIHLACDRRNRVHDLRGDVTLEDGESVDDVFDKAIEEYLTSSRIRNAHPVLVLHQRCW